MTICERLFARDPFADFEGERIPADPSGWHFHGSEFQRIADTLNPKLIVEVGTWKGASAILMASLFKEAHIICIDTWLGSAEMWENHENFLTYKSLGLRHGYPSIYYQFIANVFHFKLMDRITPMPMPSIQALRLLRQWEAKPDMVYIDGSHEAEDVLLDITHARNLGPSVICGDDYADNYPGVRWAVLHAFPSGVHLGENGFWSVDLRTYGNSNL